MAFGNVYVFNLYVEEITQFNVNSMGSAGTVVSPVKGTASPFYAAQQVVVPRSNLLPTQLQPGQVVFCNGANSILVGYEEGPWTGTVTIPAPPSPPMDADFWLYVCYKTAFLFDTFGKMVPQGGPSLTSRSVEDDESSGMIVLSPASAEDFKINLQINT